MIEKLEENPQFSSAHEVHTKKINAIIEVMEKLENSLIEAFEKLDERVDLLEEEFEYDEDVTVTGSQGIQNFLDGLKVRKPLSDEYSKDGTFEWAIIQIKKGRIVRRKSQPGGFCLFCSSHLVAFELDNNDFLAEDWEIVK